MGHALETVYHNDGYPFFFVSMVTDRPTGGLAYQRIVYDYNLVGYPTGFWDAGYQVLVGGYPELWRYRNRIELSGEREVPELELSVELTWLGSSNVQIDFTLVNKYFANEKPNLPAAPGGVAGGCIGLDYEYSASTIDPDGHQIYYRFDFDDGVITDWLGPYNSGDPCAATHAWSTLGTFSVRVQAQDEYGKTSDWSSGTPIVMHDYLAGDANGNLIVNILDITYLIGFLYMGGPPPNPYASGDANGNVVVNVLDITYLINNKYLGGPDPVYSD